MSRVSRLMGAAAISLLALAPLAASASPTPSPTLDTVLAAAPGGYTELTTSPLFHGSFTAHDYAQATGSSKADAIEETLNHLGFVDGYGKTWIHQATRRVLVEAVMAFTGAKGARSWLTAAEAGDKTDATYDHSDSISGIDPYYGAHFKYSSNSSVGDVFSFVKGNDVFVVGFVSVKDDVLNLATTQTKTQYDSAPKETIPSSQWPENASSGGSFPVLAAGLVGLLVVLAVVGVLALALRRRGTLTPAMAGAAGGMGSPPIGGLVQMSGDGNYWWDGQTWRDASHEVPPTAQRSGDGALWWDGQKWHPVPGAAPPPESGSPPTG
jgi:hypothetical protein